MVSLGMGGRESSGTNDLTRRDSMSSPIPVTTFIVREEGKSPVHYVSGVSVLPRRTFYNIMSSNWATVSATDSLVPFIAR